MSLTSTNTLTTIIMKTKTTYETPQIIEIELAVEQAILSASTPTFGIPTYGGFGEEEEL